MVRILAGAKYIRRAHNLVHDLNHIRKVIEFTASKSCQEMQPRARQNLQLRLRRLSGSSCTGFELEESLFTGRSRNVTLMTLVGVADLVQTTEIGCEACSCWASTP